MNTALTKIVEFFFNQVVKQQFITGNRSYFAGFASILGAFGIMLNMIVSGHFDEVQAGIAYAGFVLGQKIIGDAGKKDAATAATVALVDATTQVAEATIATSPTAVSALTPPEK
jgi:hypothetical protein